MKALGIKIMVLMILASFSGYSFGQSQTNMNLQDKLTTVKDLSDASNFEIDEYNLKRNTTFQKMKYQISNLNEVVIEPEFSKWNSINSNDSSLYIYIPPKPNTPRRMQITNDAVITYFHDGMYSQLIETIEKVNQTTYKFKLCHNHESPHEDGYIPATLTIINEDKGIAVWEEWRRKEEPLVFYYIKHSESKNIIHVNNKENVSGNLEFSF